MRLREEAVYVKLTTSEDLLDRGELLTLARAAEEVAGGVFELWEDLSTRTPRRPAEDGLARLEAIRGEGLHRAERSRFIGTGALQLLECNAGAHPYTGQQVTQVELRWTAKAIREEGAVERLVSFVRRCVEVARPIQLHAHDVDDHAMQGVESPRMLALGYGIAPEDLGAPDRPGKEITRGVYRLSADWVTYIGPSLRSALAEGAEARGEALRVPEHEALCDGWLFRLAPTPFHCCSPSFRDAQRALRVALGMDAYAAATGRNLGYWARRTRR